MKEDNSEKTPSESAEEKEEKAFLALSAIPLGLCLGVCYGWYSIILRWESVWDSALAQRFQRLPPSGIKKMKSSLTPVKRVRRKYRFKPPILIEMRVDS